ncbi:hypothetical protein [Leifsonia sp. NPDC080035]|uniref:DUF6916 domain-containing protein n=1 Tax=Leifsonia sp. NPDC080035 TaxID=3143936 RepID=A0AAU7GHJ4_9MICO
MPEVSRRVVMTSALGGIGVAVAASLPAAPAIARAVLPANGAESGADAAPVRSLFSPHVGRTFRAVDGDRDLTLTLDAVQDLAPDGAPGDENRFVLLFSARGSTAADGIYRLTRSGVPGVALFLNPIGPRGTTRTMQAIVNRTA